MNFSEKYVTFSTSPILKFTKYIFPLLNIVVFLLALSINSEAATGKKLPVIIITVDVETTELITMPDQLGAICAGNITCGLHEMVRLLRAKGYGATFFLNVYEYKKYGEPFLEKTAKWLYNSGQDVQLHTHPQWAYDQNRNMMYQYTLNEQTGIIRDGKKLLQKWTGQPVVAHRAGAYSADKNTLKALIVNGISYDSSLFYGWPNSKINSLELKRNAVSLYGTLLEFPVTVYKRNEYPALLSTNLKPISRIRKYDINWFVTQEEAEGALKQAMHSDLDFIILFLHSSSFIAARDSKGEMIADSAAIRRFQTILDFISANGLKVVTFREVQAMAGSANWYLNGPDRIPEVSIQIGIAEYVRKAAGINRDNYAKYILSIALFLVLLGVITSILWRHATVNKSGPR